MDDMDISEPTFVAAVCVRDHIRYHIRSYHRCHIGYHIGPFLHDFGCVKMRPAQSERSSWLPLALHLQLVLEQQQVYSCNVARTQAVSCVVLYSILLYLYFMSTQVPTGHNDLWDFGQGRMWLHGLLRHMPTGHDDIVRYLFVHLKVRMFNCSYRAYIYIYICISRLYIHECTYACIRIRSQKSTDH